MATRLTAVPEPPFRTPTLDSAFARAYGELRGAVERHCQAYPSDHELLRAHVEGIAQRLERELARMIYDRETCRWLARPK
jgi:hypothetical protein